MIINAYAVLDGLLAALRFPLALSVVGGAVAHWRIRRPSDGVSASRTSLSYLVLMLAGLLVILNLLAWPVFYLLLNSFIPQWPGVMCIYGVTQIGVGSVGPSRWLPGLLVGLQILKPAILFLGGAWGVFYAAHLRSAAGGLLPQVLWLLGLCGLFSAADAALEMAYLLIPKAEPALAVGCCTAQLDDAAHGSLFLPGSWTRLSSGAVTSAAAGLSVVLAALLWLQPFTPRLRTALLLAAIALVALPVNLLFLADVAAPRLLHLPYHRCPYDLLGQMPETAVGAAAFFLGMCCVLWAALLLVASRRASRAPFVSDMVRQFWKCGALGYASALVLFFVAWVVN